MAAELLVALATDPEGNSVSRGDRKVNLKEPLLDGGVKDGDSGQGAYQDSVQAWFPIKNIIGGVAVTENSRPIKILEVLPVNIYLKSADDRQTIISACVAYLKIAPDSLQLEARIIPAGAAEYVERMRWYAKREENAMCREVIEDNIQEIGQGVASEAIHRRFFLVFQYKTQTKAKQNTVRSTIQRPNEEADTVRRYLDFYELKALEPRYSDDFMLKLSYEIINEKTSRRL